jgi:hypothetical protein
MTVVSIKEPLTDEYLNIVTAWKGGYSFAPGADECGARFFGKITNFSFLFSQNFVQFDYWHFPENVI